jgi:glyoxylase-like metal-dependent hydrolase (beta-lactamase superfamily II)
MMAAPAAPEEPMDTPVLRETALSPRCLVLTLGGDTPLTSWGANCTAVAGRDGTLVVDPLIAPAHARLVEAALAARGFPPVTHAVLTHHHTDHALGAGWFAGRGAVCACHRACAAAMAAQHPATVEARRRDPALAPLFADAAPHRPAVAFDRDWAVDLGGVTVEARHVGPGHTPGDVAVLVPSEGLVAAGDLLFAGYHFNYEEADVDGLSAALDRLEGLGARRVVPGHGGVGGPGLIGAQRRYHEEVARLVRGAASEAAARAAVREAFPGLRLLEGVESALQRFSPGR